MIRRSRTLIVLALGWCGFSVGLQAGLFRWSVVQSHPWLCMTLAAAIVCPVAILLCFAKRPSRGVTRAGETPSDWRLHMTVVCVLAWCILSIGVIARLWRGTGAMSRPWLWVAVAAAGAVPIALLLGHAKRAAERRARVRKEATDELSVCRKCGYELTRLNVPRCPECGCALGFTKTFEELGLSDDEVREAENRQRPRSSA